MNKPKTICNHPGCPQIAEENGYCSKHKQSGWQRDRSRQNLYDRDWQRESKNFLAANPWCVECLKKNEYEPATEVDHIKPHRGNKKLFWDKKNWQGLCKHHHSQKTARGE